MESVRRFVFLAPALVFGEIFVRKGKFHFREINIEKSESIQFDCHGVSDENNQKIKAQLRITRKENLSKDLLWSYSLRNVFIKFIYTF